MKQAYFRNLYCRHAEIAVVDYNRHLLDRSLYPHARPLVGLLTRMDSHYFQADYEFVEDVGHMERRSEFRDVAQSYVEHPSNGRFLRRSLRLRVSMRRMHDVVRTILPPDKGRVVERDAPDKDSLTPFDQDKTT